MAEQRQHSLLNTTFPVTLPAVPELVASRQDFATYIASLLKKEDATEPVVIAAASPDKSHATPSEPAVESAFMTALLSDNAAVPSFDDRDGKMLTENSDVAHKTSGAALVDLFFELEDVISGKRLRETLENAWAVDPDATLKIIWNARSIPLGKSSRSPFYRASGWLYEKHPATFILNLPWLVRPLIPKKTVKKDDGKQASEANDKDKGQDMAMIDAQDADSDFDMVEEHDLPGQPDVKKTKLDEDTELSEFDVKYGASHGYWKDLLNMLALAVNGQLAVDGDVRSILNVAKLTGKPRKRDWTKDRKHAIIAERHERALDKLKTDPVYKALHLSIARLFADQIKLDTLRLNSGSKKDLKAISFAAKWAPSLKGMHDEHTFITSTIAEILHPFDSVCPTADPADRTLYLKYARQEYQLKTLSRLRKHLDVVERKISAEKFDEIIYSRVPSLAMKQYTPLFAKKDHDGFDKYIEDVAQGKAKISGATLLPSTLVAAVPDGGYGLPRGNNTDQLVQEKIRKIQTKSLGGQWNTLVQSCKDNGTLDSSIAVCDVSGSMGYPRFPDGTCPMDSSIGLSLLIAELTKPPFGGAFITFSDYPQILRVGGADDKRTFAEKIAYIQGSNWSMSTDFVAVFEKLILPMAKQHKLKQEDMVKQVFVFSDMQFNAAGDSQRWSTSYERIKKQYEEAGYQMPRLIFWNLAGGRAGYYAGYEDDEDVAPKPVTASDEGTALVSGYSQGQLKAFLDGGGVDDAEEEEIKMTEDGDEVLVGKEKKANDPLATVKKAISHDAYRMLKVVD